MKIDLQGKNLVSHSRIELEAMKRELLNAVNTIDKELMERGPHEIMGYGFPVTGGWTAFDTFPEAAAEAVRHFNDPEAGYKVVKVYI